MPYCFGEGDPGWDELAGEDDAGRPPKASQFRYLTPPDIGGPPAPAWFSDQVPSPRAASAPIARPSWQEREVERERHTQHWLALIVAALREIDGKRVYGRYDGGNDEGFAWLEHVVLASGERLTPDELAERLAATRLRQQLAEAGLWRDQWGTGPKAMRDIALFTLAEECAVKLLGRGFGTGPFYMYGAFTVDLDTCTISDDRNADAVAHNFTLET